LTATVSGNQILLATTQSIATNAKPIFSKLTLTDTPLEVGSGGTGSNVAMEGNRLIVSSGQAMVEATATAHGQLFIGDATTGNFVASSLTASGTDNSLVITHGPGTIDVDTVQSIRKDAVPEFAGLILAAPLPVSSGGTNSNADLTGARVMVSKIGADSKTRMVEGPALSSGQFLMGSVNGADPIVAAISTSGIDLTATVLGNQIQIATIQSIATSARPTFAELTLADKALAVASGGTGSNTSLLGKRPMVSSGAGGVIMEGPALTLGQFMMMGTSDLIASSITTDNVDLTVTLSADGSTLALATTQSIAPDAKPRFAEIKLGTEEVAGELSATKALMITAPEIHMGSSDSHSFYLSNSTVVLNEGGESESVSASTNNGAPITVGHLFQELRVTEGQSVPEYVGHMGVALGHVVSSTSYGRHPVGSVVAKGRCTDVRKFDSRHYAAGHCFGRYGLVCCSDWWSFDGVFFCQQVDCRGICYSRWPTIHRECHHRCIYRRHTHGTRYGQ
jgi:hypothetical protein